MTGKDYYFFRGAAPSFLHFMLISYCTRISDVRVELKNILNMTPKTKIRIRNCKSAAKHHIRSESEIHEERNFFFFLWQVRIKILKFWIKKALVKVSTALQISVPNFFGTSSLSFFKGKQTTCILVPLFDVLELFIELRLYLKNLEYSWICSGSRGFLEFQMQKVNETVKL